jgi:mannitol/fructose-specific phosphotransferase system IIA component (Ntr-type)
MELVSLLELDPKSKAEVVQALKRRESIASTGIGRGVAIPHCRTASVSRLRAAYGKTSGGVEFGAIDDRPVYDFFLIVAPPLEISSDYLPALGQIARLVKEPGVLEQLEQLESPQQFMALLEKYSR